MAKNLFGGRVILSTASATATPGVYNTTLAFLDAEGVYSGINVLVNDILIFDTGPVETGTITEYFVNSITSQTASTIVCQVTYDPSNRNPGGIADITALQGERGAITRRSGVLGLTALPDSSVQGLPSKLATHVRNFDFFDKIDRSYDPLCEIGDRKFFYSKLQKIVDGVNEACVIVPFGDSVGGYPVNGWINKLQRQLPPIGIGFSATSINASSGTIANARDTTIWPLTIPVLAAGATQTFGVGGGSPASNVVTVYIPRQPGGGSVTIDVLNQAGALVQNIVTNVTTAGTKGQCLISTVTLGVVQQVQVRITAVTGPVPLAGVLFRDTTRGGVVYAPMNEGGLPINAYTGTGMGTITAVVQNLSPSLFTYCMRESSGDFVRANINTFVDSVRSVSVNANWIFIGCYPIVTDGTLKKPSAGSWLESLAVRECARRIGGSYLDAFTLFESVAKIELMGTYDGIHLPPAGEKFLSSVLEDNLGLTRITGMASGDNVHNLTTRTSRLHVTREANLPYSDNPEGFTLTSDVFGLDGYGSCHRWFSLCDMAKSQNSTVLHARCGTAANGDIGIAFYNSTTFANTLNAYARDGAWSLRVDPTTGAINLTSRVSGALQTTTLGAGGGGGGSVSDAAYSVATWDGQTAVAPSQNAVSDALVSKIDLLKNWNASTNTPAITAATAISGSTLFHVTASGTQSVTGASVVFGVGDLLAWSGAAWLRVAAGSLLPDLTIRSTQGNNVAVHRAESSFGLDAEILVNRHLDIKTSDGVTTKWRLSANAGGQSFIPDGIRIGDTTGNFIKSFTDSSFVFSRGSSPADGSLQADVQAKSFVAQTQTLVTAAATTTIDLNFGCRILLTLQANTNIVFTNSPNNGGQISLYLIQDATGGRAVTFPSNFKFQGSAFTPTATANRLDILCFEAESGGYYEIRRSQNLN